MTAVVERQPRGTCSVCFRSHALKVDGTVHIHGVPAPNDDHRWRRWEECPGSALAPSVEAVTW